MAAKVNESQKRLYIELGKNIKEARGKRLSQADLAKASSLTRTSITNIEKGRQHLPLHTLYAIANALKVSVAELLPNQNQPNEEILIENIPENLKPQEVEWIKKVASTATKK
jgi:transcriptional regulator with XRE-family HTH domain